LYIAKNDFEKIRTKKNSEMYLVSRAEPGDACTKQRGFVKTLQRTGDADLRF